MDPASSPYFLSPIVLIVVAALLYAFASVAEGAVGSLTRARIQRLSEQNHIAARRIQDFADHPTVYLTVATIVKLAALIAASLATIQLLEFGRLGTSTLAAWLALLVGALVLGWIVPRSASAGSPETVAIALATPLRVLAWAFGPIVALLAHATSGLSRLFGARELADSQVVTPAELKEMVAASEEEGLIERRERTMIDNILDLEDISVREVMVPRPDIDALPSSITVREAVDRFVREGFSRLPVYRESIDDIAGILYGKDLFPLLVDGRGEASIGGFARPAYFVPESKKCGVLLRELQQKRVQIAIVVDEYGGTAGLVTIEDLLEEIVGEIQDEFDTEEQRIILAGNDEALVDALVSIDDVNDVLSLALTTDEVDTIGGLLYEKLGRVPVIGDEVRVDRALLTVVGAHGRRVTRVRVKRFTDEQQNGSSNSRAPLGEK